MPNSPRWLPAPSMRSSLAWRLRKRFGSGGPIIGEFETHIGTDEGVFPCVVCLLQRRALLRNQLLDLLREFRGGHVFGFLFSAGADVDFVGFGFFVSYHQQEGNFLHGV